MSIFYCDGCGTQRDADYVGIEERNGKSVCVPCAEDIDEKEEQHDQTA